MNRTRFASLCCNEPFRIFFPFGVLIGISGVSLWPLFFTGLHQFYPGIMHARLMIEGFMGAFVIGFLRTAVPRLTRTARLSRAELITLLVLLTAVVGIHIAHRHFLADLLFLALLLFFASCLGWRCACGAEVPPPPFVLVAFGFFNAVLGTASLLLAPLGSAFAPAALLAPLLLYQGFLLSLLLGLSAFLLPSFLVLPAKLEVPETREISRPWIRGARFSAGMGTVLLASFAVEVFAEAPRLAGAIRCAATPVYLLAHVPLHPAAPKPATISRSSQLALILLGIGLLFPLLWPGQRIAGLHIVFIGALTLIAFTVATRVLLEQTGHSDLLSRPLPFLRFTATLLLLAMAFRVAGDFAVQNRALFLDIASYAWMFGAIVWSGSIFPKLRNAPSQTR